MNNHEFRAWVERGRNADLLEHAVRLGATLKRAGREHTGPCPMCGGNDRFSINPVKGKWHCRGHGGGGDAINMVMHIAGMSFMEAVQEITGDPPPNGPAKPLSDAEREARNRLRIATERAKQERQKREAAYEADTREAAQAIWDGSGPISGTVAERYLTSRGLPIVETGVLRFHSSLPYPGKTGRYPALICRVDDLAGHLTSIWRIFLRADGRKADVPNAKLGLGPTAGGAVKFGGAGQKIGLAEGVESALGAWNLTGRRFPVWSCLSTSGLINIDLPIGVELAVIFPDGDRPLKKQGHDFVPAVPAGRKAALALRERLLSQGVCVAIAAEPPMGKDYLDMWTASLREECA